MIYEHKDVVCKQHFIAMTSQWINEAAAFESRIFESNLI